MERDPVCGMDVEPDEAPAEIEYEGQTFYFCSTSCKMAFEKDPSRYRQKVTR
jgi:YHS domain-containing protein